MYGCDYFDGGVEHARAQSCVQVPVFRGNLHSCWQSSSKRQPWICCTVGFSVAVRPIYFYLFGLLHAHAREFMLL